jgi:hypothetical protein
MKLIVLFWKEKDVLGDSLALDSEGVKSLAFLKEIKSPPILAGQHL